MIENNDNNDNLWMVTLAFNEIISINVAEEISDILEEVAVSISLNNNEAVDGDNWLITLNTIGEPNLDIIFNLVESKKPKLISKENIEVKELPKIDWLEHVYKRFPPVETNKFFIYGSHYKDEIPEALIPIQIDAVTAFGSGEHETTRACIECLEYLSNEIILPEFKYALDMGCGSGILSIAISKLWDNTLITAIDIDPESIEVTKRYIMRNNVGSKISLESGNGYESNMVINNPKYNLIVANILANPLIEMAKDLENKLEINGYCILSGFLEKQHDNVVSAHTDIGLKLLKICNIGEWQAVIMQKKGNC